MAILLVWPRELASGWWPLLVTQQMTSMGHLRFAHTVVFTHARFAHTSRCPCLLPSHSVQYERNIDNPKHMLCKPPFLLQRSLKAVSLRDRFLQSWSNSCEGWHSWNLGSSSSSETYRFRVWSHGSNELCGKTATNFQRTKASALDTQGLIRWNL